MNRRHVAARLDAIACSLAATKARPAAEIAAERALETKLAGLFRPELDRIASTIVAQGMPAGDISRQQLLARLARLQREVGELVADDLVAQALQARQAVETAVAAQRAAKSLEDSLRPYGADRQLYQRLSGIPDRIVRSFVERTASVLATSLDDPTVLPDLFAELLETELRRLSRNVLRDTEQVATVETEKQLGVQWHQWNTVGDDEVRDAHADVDGEIQRVGRPFSNGWRYPPVHIGCRCSLTPHLQPDAAVAA